jgi:HSP90 family molecular chaperone
VSREILQQNRILLNIKNAPVKKFLSEFKTLADRAAADGKSESQSRGLKAVNRAGADEGVINFLSNEPPRKYGNA